MSEWIPVLLLKVNAVSGIFETSPSLLRLKRGEREPEGRGELRGLRTQTGRVTCGSTAESETPPYAAPGVTDGTLQTLQPLKSVVNPEHVLLKPYNNVILLYITNKGSLLIDKSTAVLTADNREAPPTDNREAPPTDNREAPPTGVRRVTRVKSFKHQNDKTIPARPCGGEQLWPRPLHHALLPPAQHTSLEQLEEDEEAKDSFDVDISVTSPEKVGDGMNAFVAYRVSTRVSLWN
ncbi:unnamed protein product [Knipowitschia caucasica]